jgi:hypothetical protein
MTTNTCPQEINTPWVRTLCATAALHQRKLDQAEALASGVATGKVTVLATRRKR